MKKRTIIEMIVVIIIILVISIDAEHGGYIEYIDETYNSTNRLTVGTTLINYTMTEYSTREIEKPNNIENTDWFNGTHILTDKAGNSYLYRLRYKAEPQDNNLYCEFFFNIGGSIGQLPMRQISFPKGIGNEQIGTFTNIEYTLDTWYDNGALIQIECSGDIEFWDLELTIERIHVGKGVY